MKRISLLFCAFALVLSSCNKDDDNGSSQDLLIGTWTYFKALENGVEIPLTDCEKQETQIFYADSTFTITYFDDFNGPCVEDFAFSGTWSNSGNSVYTITAFGETDSQSVVFADNTYSVSVTETDGTETITYTDVYLRN